jgi:hypothetical protein
MMLGVPSQTAAQVSTEKPATMSVIHFRGLPGGGGFKLWIKARILEIATLPGEDLAQMAKDAAEKINTDPEMKTQGITAKTRGNSLMIHVNEVWVFLCPTDKGLEVPPAPYDLRVRREGDGVFHLSWELPPGGYDRIHVLRGTVPIADGIGGTNTTFGDANIVQLIEALAGGHYAGLQMPTLFNLGVALMVFGSTPIILSGAASRAWSGVALRLPRLNGSQ